MQIRFNEDVCWLLIGIVLIFILYKLFNKLILPIIINHSIKKIEVNPKWIISKTKDLYGFSDIEFIIAESPFAPLPRFCLTKDNKFQLLISEDTLTSEVDDIIRFALVGKVKVKYGLWFPDKPLYWLSVLCFMLDGGDIRMEGIKWENKKDKKPIDL